MNLEGKVVVITGGGRGLGHAFASELADKGANLALVDLNQDDLNATKEMALAKGVKAQTYVTNVANCLLYTSPSPRDATLSRMPSSA